MIDRETVRDAWLAAQLSPRTAETYRYAVVSWFAFCDGRGVDVQTASKVDGNAWRGTLMRRMKNTTVVRYLATMRSFYRTAMDDYGWPTDPFRGVRKPRVDDAAHGDGLTNDEARAVLAEAAAGSARNAALVWLMLGTAARVSEIVGARVEDLGWNEDRRTLAVTRKGGAVGWVPLSPGVVGAVEVYLAERGDPERGWLLTSGAGRALSRQWAYQIVRSIAARAIDRPVVIGPHDLRRTALSMALDSLTLQEVRQFAGHKHASTTELYDRRAGSRGSRAADVVADIIGGGRESA